MWSLPFLDDIGGFDPPLALALLQYVGPDRFPRLFVGEFMRHRDVGSQEPDLLDLR